MDGVSPLIEVSFQPSIAVMIPVGGTEVCRIKKD
jgi:hypothetical protein